MKSLVSIVLLALLAVSLSGCMIVDRHSRHRPSDKPIVTTPEKPGQPGSKPESKDKYHNPGHDEPEPGYPRL